MKFLALSFLLSLVSQEIEGVDRAQAQSQHGRLAKNSAEKSGRDAHHIQWPVREDRAH
jgi:hypothetical protein